MRTVRVISFAASLAILAHVASTDAQISRTDIKKGTWSGQLFEYSCFKGEKGIDSAAPEHTACILECLKKGGPENFLALLTDDEGFMKIAGEMAKDKYAKMHQYVGKRIEVTGVSYFPMTGSYQPRELEIEKIALTK